MSTNPNGDPLLHLLTSKQGSWPSLFASSKQVSNEQVAKVFNAMDKRRSVPISHFATNFEYAVERAIEICNYREKREVTGRCSELLSALKKTMRSKDEEINATEKEEAVKSAIFSNSQNYIILFQSTIKILGEFIAENYSEPEEKCRVAISESADLIKTLIEFVFWLENLPMRIQAHGISKKYLSGHTRTDPLKKLQED